MIATITFGDIFLLGCVSFTAGGLIFTYLGWLLRRTVRK